MKTRTLLIAVSLCCTIAAYAGSPEMNIPVRQVSDTGKVADMVLLARVWGYLKYFSPAISERNVDWDGILISQLRYLDENPSAGIREPIRVMLDSAAVVRLPGRDAGARQLAGAKAIEKVNVDHSWIAAAPQLTDPEKECLSALADHFKPFRNKYIETPDVTGAASPKFKEDTYGKDYLPEKHYRLLALFRYWNIIEYYLPAKYQQNGTWPATLATLIPEFTNAVTNRAYGRALLKLNAAITDGHTVVPTVARYPELVLSGKLMRMPFSMGVIGDTVFVMQTDSGYSELSGIRKGDRVHTVNGVSVRRYVDSLLALMSDPRAEMKEYYVSMSGMLRMLPQMEDSLTIGYESEGKQRIFTMPFGASEEAMYARANAGVMKAQTERMQQQPPPSALRMLEGDVLFIDPSKWTGKMSDTTRKLLAKAKSLIIECRTYPNFDFINFTHFLFKRKTECILWNGIISYPGLTKSSPYFRGPDHTIHFKGKVVAIISERSISRPEMLTMIVKARGGETTLIGRTTGGADGDVTQIPMIGNQEMRFVISGLGVLYPDAGYTQGIGIKPDIEVRNSVAQALGEKDLILERALEFLSANN